jgi:hypothetical protein
MIKLRHISIISAAQFALASPALAQVYPSTTVPATIPDTRVILHDVSGPHFFAAVVAGVILALAFQGVLTVFSMAMGLSLTPNLMKAEANRKAARPITEIEDEDDTDEHALAKHGIVNSLGLWALVTTSVALFGAAWLAVKLSLVQVNEQGVVIALVIWATFFLLVSYLEWQGVRSLIGGVMSIAHTNFHSGVDFLKGLGSKSQARKVEDYGRKTARAIYEELADMAHKDRLDKKLSKYLMQLKPANLDFDKIHDEVVDILSQIRIEQSLSVHEDQAAKVLSIHMDKGNSFLNPENAAKLKQTVKKAARTVQENNFIDKASSVAEKVLPLSVEEAKALEDRIFEFLGSTERQELDPESIRADIEDIFQHPEATVDIIRARLSHFDRDTLKSVLVKSGRISEGQVDDFADSVMEILATLRGRYQKASDKAGRALVVLTGELPQSARQKLIDYFDSLNRPELNYEAIKMDIEDILHDPKAAPAIVKNRISQMDQETLAALIRSNPWLSNEQAEVLAEQISESFDKIAHNVSVLQERALSQYERVRYRAILTAERARENAIAASWWVFTTAILSGGAAVLGGYFAAHYV